MKISRRHFSGAGAASALGLLAGSQAALAQFRVEISGIGGTQLPVAVPRFRDEERSGQQISTILRADLERSGVFSIVDSTGSLDELSQPQMAEWRTRSADALVVGSVTRLADNRMDVRYKLWDVVKGVALSGESVVVSHADLRLAAHRIADSVQAQLTGERGVNATRIAYVTRVANRFSLRIADADGDGGQVALASAQPVISPAWSPDGRQLAYVSFERGKAEVVVQDVNNGQRQIVASFRGSNSAPAWSPDGRRLAVTLSRDGPSQIYLMDTTGSNLRRLTTTAAIDTEATFSPDGQWIYFVSDRGGGPQIYRMPVGGGSADRVTFSGAYNISPAVSPDGRWLAWVSRGAGFKVMLQPIDGSAQPQAVSDTLDDESPSFAPNSKLLLYATRALGQNMLMSSTLDGKHRARLLATSADLREPAWGPIVR